MMTLFKLLTFLIITGAAFGVTWGVIKVSDNHDKVHTWQVALISATIAAAAGIIAGIILFHTKALKYTKPTPTAKSSMMSPIPPDIVSFIDKM